MSWSVVATVDEPPVLVEAFARWHLAQGADQVHLFFDRANPDAFAKVAALPGVQATLCDAAYWDRHHNGFRGPRQTNRQMANANLARAGSRSDWMIHCDADEFIRSGADLSQALSAMPDDIDILRLGMLERIQPMGDLGGGIFDGIYRRRDFNFESWGDDVYGRWAKFLIFGLTGQAAGKVALRRGSDLRLGIHYAERADRSHCTDELRLADALYHFDGLTPVHYLVKMLRRVTLEHFMMAGNPDGPQRQRQIKFMQRNAGDPDALDAFLMGVKMILPEQERALDAKGLLFDEHFDPGAALDGLDLSSDHFDAALRAHLPEVFAAFPEVFGDGA